MNLLIKSTAVLLLGAGTLLAAPKGEVYDYRPDTRQITILPDKTGAFPIGKKIYIFRGKKEIAQGQISMDMFSKAYARLTQGNPPRPKDIVLSSAGDIHKYKENKSKTISFKDIASRGRAWNVLITYPGHEPQTRKIKLSHDVALREEKDAYYTMIPASEIKIIEIFWDTKIMSGTGVILKNKKKLMASDMLLADITKRIKPPSSIRDKEVKGLITLQKPADMLEEFPEVVQIDFQAENTLGLPPTFILKVYSNFMFVHSETIHKAKESAGTKRVMSVSSGNLFPGKNNLEIQLVPAEAVADDFFEKSDAIPLGNISLDIQGIHTNHLVTITGPGKGPKGIQHWNIRTKVAE